MPPSIDTQQSMAVKRMLLGHHQDEEESAEILAAAEERRASAALPPRPLVAVVPPRAPVGVEPAFEFSVVLPVEELKDVSYVFQSQFMLDVVSAWPQPIVSRKRKQMNQAGKESPGARPSADRGSNASLKTWSTRIRTACAFANFVGSTVCLHAGEERPDDAEIDRGVRKFFRCLTPYTKLVITTFLECRHRGYIVAGGGKPLSATSLKDYSSGLAFLFTEAKVDGARGVTPLVPDCCERTSPWQPKGVAEYREEQRVRQDPGGFTGNPMATADVRDFRGATNKAARHDGETQLSSAAVTTSMMERLYDVMVRAHMPAEMPDGSAPTTCDAMQALQSEMLAAGEGAPRPRALPDEVVAAGTAPADDSAVTTFVPPSNALADCLTYVFYVIAFVLIARPVTIINMQFKDVVLPDMMVAENQEFFNK